MSARVRPWTDGFETPLLARIEEDVRGGPHPAFRFLSRRPIPWAAPRAATCELRVALITSAGLHLAGDERFRVYEQPLGDASLRRIPHAAPLAALDLDAPYLDRKFLLRDPEVGLPRRALDALVAHGAVGGAAAHHLSFCGGVIEPYPELASSVEQALACLEAEEVGACVLVPTCSICVQTLALVASEIETAGIPTVTLALLPELARIAGAPRALATRFPLGAPMGDPENAALQQAVLAEALTFLQEARTPGELRTSPLRWRRSPRAAARST